MATSRIERLKTLLKNYKPFWTYSFICTDKYEIEVKNEVGKSKRVQFDFFKWNRMTDSEIVDKVINAVYIDLKRAFE